MPNRRGRQTKRRGKSYPEPWINSRNPWLYDAEPLIPNTPCTSQPLNHCPSEFSISQEPWNQLPFQCINHWPPEAFNQQSSEQWVPMQHTLQNELPLQIWDQPLRVPLLQLPHFSSQTAQSSPLLPNPVQVNYTSGKSATPIQHKIAAPSHSLSRAPLLSTPSSQSFTSNRSKSIMSSTSYQPTIAAPLQLRRRTPLLPTPSGQPCNSNNGNATFGLIRRKSSHSNLSSRDPSAISDSSKKRKRSSIYSDQHSSIYSDQNSSIYSDQHSSIDTEIDRPPKKPTSFRKIELKENGEMQIRVGNAEDAEEEDVQYLFSVDNKEGKLIELIDLSKDSQTSEKRNSYTLIDLVTKAKELRYAECCYTSPITFDEKETRFVEGTKKHQKAHCNICLRSYENLYNNKCDLYMAKCGHLFCVLCLKKFKSNKCVNCGKAFSNFSKIVL